MGQEAPLEEGTVTHSSILAWRIPGTEEPGGLQSTGSQRVGHNWSYLACMHTHVILYTENPKDVTRQLLEPIHEFGRVDIYKINIQKSVAWLYTDSKTLETAIKETISFTTISKKNKISRNKPAKEAKELYSKNYETLMKGTEDMTIKEIYQILELEAFMLKWPHHPRKSTDSRQALSKYQWHSHRTRIKKFKFMCKHKDSK